MKWLLYCNILMISLFSGCDSSENNNDTGTYRIYKEYLVDAYLEVEKMYVRQLNATTLELYFSGKKYGITSENASEVAKFKELAVKHNDDFSDYITVDFGYTVGNYVSYAENFTGIEIRSSISWGEGHSAGSTLNDLCYFTAYSFAPTLKDHAKGGLTHIRKHADELSAADLELLQDGFLRLAFSDENSRLSEAQVITISLSTLSGRVLKGKNNAMRYGKGGGFIKPPFSLNTPRLPDRKPCCRLCSGSLERTC